MATITLNLERKKKPVADFRIIKNGMFVGFRNKEIAVYFMWTIYVCF